MDGDDDESSRRIVDDPDDSPSGENRTNTGEDDAAAEDDATRFEPAALSKPKGQLSTAKDAWPRMARIWAVPALLLTLGIACMGAAWSLYPIAEIPLRPAPLDVTIEGSAPEVKLVSVAVGANPKEDFSVVSVRVVRNLGAADGEISVGVSIDGHFLKNLDDVNCDPRCSIDESPEDFANPFTFFSMELSEWRALADANQLVADAVMQIPNRLLGLDDDVELDTLGMRCTELACRGITPFVQYTGDVDLAESPVAMAHFSSPTLGAYNWDADVQPRFVDKQKAFLTLEFPLTKSTDFTSGSAYRVDGDNPNELRTVEFQTFLSGAFVGLAGALILASFQEGLATRRSRRIRPRL